MSSLAPLRLDPGPLFDASSVQHATLTDHARAEASQAVGTIVLQTDRVRQMLLAVAAGQALPRHRASCDATVTVIAGAGRLTLDGAEPVGLGPGVHLFLPAGTPHAVEAEEALTLLATFAEAAPEIHFSAPA